MATMTSSLDDTIAALSTPTGESALAVVRLSGPSALAILTRIFRRGAPIGPGDWEHRRTYHGYIMDGDDVVDEVVCAISREPESYTGEDTVEMTCHGNTLIVRRLLEVMYTAGARPAEAGEFTKRAFLNGKMDLIQAEAVADLIHARSQLQRQVAQQQLAGRLSTRIHELADELLALLGLIEANIDFIEEDIDTLDVGAALDTLERHGTILDELLEYSDLARPFHEGYRVAITGPVNAGKSSLFNRLVGDNRAIVTEIPGTTRDVLREPMVLEGLLFMLHDTAGLRDTEDHIESIGVDRAMSAIGTADVVVHVLDASVEEHPVLPALPHGRAVVALNKADLPARVRPDDLPDGTAVIRTSARTGEGVDDLRKSLVECVGRDRLDWIARERVVLNARLTSILREARTKLARLSASFRDKAPLEILALDARETLQLYETATGKRYSDDLLDTIFARFCIGK
jgi:tRNA modification GTPase